MSLLTKTLSTLGVTATGLVLLGTGGWVIDQRAAASLSALMTERVAPLLPGGAVEHVEVTDSPALLAARRQRVQQAVVDGRTADGHPVTVFVRELDRDSGLAESVSWQVEGLPLAPGWTGLRDDAGVYLNAAERDVDGHRVRVSATAQVEGSVVAVDFGDLTVDGVPTALQDAPADVREQLDPLTLAVPVAGPQNVVRSIWFDERGVGVDLRATDVALSK